jgi:hypothetical protein
VSERILFTAEAENLWYTALERFNPNVASRKLLQKGVGSRLLHKTLIFLGIKK